MDSRDVQREMAHTAQLHSENHTQMFIHFDIEIEIRFSRSTAVQVGKEGDRTESDEPPLDSPVHVHAVSPQLILHIAPSSFEVQHV